MSLPGIQSTVVSSTNPSTTAQAVEPSPAQQTRMARHAQAHHKSGSAPSTAGGANNAFAGKAARGASAAATGDDGAVSRGPQGPQVTAEEQAQAMLSRGLDEDRQRKTGRLRELAKRVYQAAFTMEESFLELDIKDQEHALLTGSRSAVDKSESLTEDQKALRTYLLLNMLADSLERRDPPDTALLRKVEAKIASLWAGPRAPYIQQALRMYANQVGAGASTVDLREKMRMFRAVKDDLRDGAEAGGFNGLYHLYQRLIGQANDETFPSILARASDERAVKIERHKAGGDALKASQHLLLTEKRKLQVLEVAFKLHKAFLSSCSQFVKEGLPSALNLLGSTLKIVSSFEVTAGIREVVNTASNLGSEKPNASHIYMVNYNNKVLASPVLERFYGSGYHRVTVVDMVQKNLVAGALCANRSRGSEAASAA